MGKRIEFTKTAAFWLLSKDFITEDVIINIIQDFPVSKRMPQEKDCFKIEFRRRKRWITIWVHEYPEKLLVYKLHSSSKLRKK
jgi:hypothetical protein